MLLDVGWLERLTTTPLLPPTAPRKPAQGVELEEIRKPGERYGNLALSMANAMVEMSKAMYMPMHKFEGDP